MNLRGCDIDELWNQAIHEMRKDLHDVAVLLRLNMAVVREIFVAAVRKLEVLCSM